MNYASIARFYDLLHEGDSADRDFLLDRVGLGNRSILELGCGTGRLLFPLAEAGYQVVGLDSDSAMLGMAREKLAAYDESVRKRVGLIEGDARGFELEQRFDLIAIMGNTFMHFARSERQKVLSRCRHHLHDEGRLILDLANPMEVLANTVEHVVQLEQNKIVAESGQRLLQFSSSTIADDGRILQVTWMFDTLPAEGGPLQRQVLQTDYHLIHAHELELLLDGAGFELLELLGDYQGGRYDENGSRLIALAKGAQRRLDK